MVMNELFNLQISENDCFPQNMCGRCFLELQTVYSFRDKLLQSDKSLRSTSTEERDGVAPGSIPAQGTGELIDHKYRTIEIISTACYVCGKPSNDSGQSYMVRPIPDGADISGSDSTKAICTECQRKPELLEEKDDDTVPAQSLDIDILEQCPIKEANGSELKCQRFCCVTHCKEMFENELDLVEHAQQLHSLKLRWNEQRQQSDKPFKCNVCFRAFNSSKNLRIHQFVRSNQLGKLYPCRECPFRAVSNALLTIHERSHTGERPFVCTVCKKRFFSELNLKNHQVCHQTERPFGCSYCSKSFARKRNMEDHFRVCHSDEKPYQCVVCSAQFKVPQHLRLHQRLHTGEKPYRCSYCPMCFYNTSDRKRHELSHTGEKPYTCVCGVAYTRKRTLTIHERTHTGERPFNCDVCGKTFIQSSLLKRHTARHHNVQMDRDAENEAECAPNEASNTQSQRARIV
ncbi:zinc finger protein OZF-like [Anopheles bellator]|uniref:zinc finger protein OZF-like n=1 Tax=Anopheles bellator TaxID=139047 RepID=UPI002647DFA2|nr:zinc finger protein OZF-like [Anopheles bellator]